jgi:L-serine/L-threonine ammonia-lyase
MKLTHVVTPLWESRPLSAALGAPVLLKMEAFQPVGSFKARGMGAACRAAKEAGATGVLCSSGGNAGYAVAYAGRQLGLNVTIVVPETTSTWAKDLIRSEGADLLVHGAAWDDAHAYALELVEQKQSVYVHPFDDPNVWSGHASMIHEIAEVGIKPGAIVVSVGGGGLLCGLVQGLHEVGWTDVPLLAVETEGAASFAASVQAGRIVTLDKITSIAITLGARTVTAQALEWARRHPIDPWVVSDRAALDACLRFADDHRVLVEPACGAALAAAYRRAQPLEGREPVVIVVCGGAGVNRELLEQWDQRVPASEALSPNSTFSRSNSSRDSSQSA